ncbi:UNVERIFIED_ORG: hypothetical protein GGD58_001008 [Rhizobium pisi]
MKEVVPTERNQHSGAVRRISGILATLRAEQGSRGSLSIAAVREAEPTAPARAFLLRLLKMTMPSTGSDGPTAS